MTRKVSHDSHPAAMKEPPSCFSAFADFGETLRRLVPVRDPDYFVSSLVGEFRQSYHPQRMTSEARLTLLRDLQGRVEREASHILEARSRFDGYAKELDRIHEPDAFFEIHREFMCRAAEQFLSDASVVGLQDRLTAFRERLTRRLLKVAEKEMVAEGFGPVPARFAWMALGSDGRGEQTFATDQDNLIVYEATEESQKALVKRLDTTRLTRLLRFDQGETLESADKIDLTGRYFWRFCEKMGDLLDAVGIDRCKGHIMPAYDKWRGTLSRWERRLIGKVRYGAGELSILDMNILMDCRFVAGDNSLGKKFMELLHTYLPENPDILNQIAHSAILMPIALGMFKRLKVKRSGPDKGTLDLKLNGWAPLTILIRVLCVKNRLMGETHTLRRLSLLQSHRLLDKKIAEGLEDAYYHLMVFRALYQITRLARGLPKGNAIDPSWLDEEGQDLLRKSLNTVEALQDQINRSFFGGAV